MTDIPPILVIIILHYGDIADTRACLIALTPGLPPDWRVLVIDNGTGTGAAETLGLAFPAIDTVTLAVNQGWAGGNNAGIMWARSRGAQAVCLLNNDTLATAEAFATLLETLERFGDCLLHPAIDYGNPDDGIQLDPAEAPSPASLPDQPHLYTLDFAYGACLMIPCSVFDRVGLLDERFFLQLEETDFFLRAKAHGIPSLCLTSARIIHFESRSFGARVTPRKLYYIARNRFLLWEKHDRSVGGLFRIGRNIYWRAAIESPKPLRWLASREPGARAIRVGIIDYCRRRFGPAPDYPFLKSSNGKRAG
jgi:GT2 family glycosyltransferase